MQGKQAFAMHSWGVRCEGLYAGVSKEEPYECLCIPLAPALEQEPVEVLVQQQNHNLPTFEFLLILECHVVNLKDIIESQLFVKYLLSFFLVIPQVCVKAADIWLISGS